MDGFKTLPRYKAGGLVKTPVTGDKKAAAPSKAVAKPAFKGSDVAKEKSKPAGHKDLYIKSKDVATEAAPSAAIKGRNKKANGTVNKFKCGGKIVKKADGGIMDAIGGVGTQLKNNVMGTPEQNRIAQAQMDKVKARKAAQAAALLQGQGPSGALEQGALAGGLGGVAPMPSAPQGPQTAPMPQPSVAPQGVGAGLTPMKKGGKVKGKC